MNIMIVGGAEHEVEEWQYILDTVLPNVKPYHAKAYIDMLSFFSKDPPSLVLLSISFEDYDWTEGVDLIRSIDPDLPIVLISGDERLAVKAFSYKIFDYLVKPIRKEQIERTIKKMKKIVNQHVKGRNV